MSKLKWRQRKQKKAERAEKEEKLKRRRFPYQIIVQKSCGCCDATLNFVSKASADAAFAKVGLTIASITDDSGETCSDVDTFYGYRRPTSKDRRGLGYLIGRLNQGLWQ